MFCKLFRHHAEQKEKVCLGIHVKISESSSLSGWAYWNPNRQVFQSDASDCWFATWTISGVIENLRKISPSFPLPENLHEFMNHD
jgi:hypothetical protein